MRKFSVAFIQDIYRQHLKLRNQSIEKILRNNIDLATILYIDFATILYSGKNTVLEVESSDLMGYLQEPWLQNE